MDFARPTSCPKCGKELDGTSFDYGTEWECSSCFRDKTDVLHTERGCKVMAANLDSGWPSDSKRAHQFLVEGSIYEVESVNVGSWQSSISLKEFPKERFNTVHFVRCE